MPLSFGQVIPVTGPVLGFPGTISRVGERVVASREYVPTTSSNNLNFGDPAVLIENSTGGYWDSVADFVAASAANIALVAAQFAGGAVREVQTQLTYPAGQQPGILQVGYYAANTMADVLERGSMTVLLAVGTPVAGGQIYTRVVANGAVPNSYVGDWEAGPLAVSDLFSTTGTGSEGSPDVTLASGTNTVNGQVVSGPGIPPGTYLVSGGGTTSAVLSQNLTQATSGALVTFSNLVALPSVVARTGVVDTNSVCEVTIKNRNAA
jgi:hypothetical protein